MIVGRVIWLSWNPPDILPEAELQIAQRLAAHGRSGYAFAFLGLSKSKFRQVHAPGMFYLGLGFFFAFFAPYFSAVCACGFIIYYFSLLIAFVRYMAWLNGIQKMYSLANATMPSVAQKDNDHTLYEIVTREIDQGQYDKVLWTRAIANSAGDDKLAASLYIGYRVQSLQELRTQQTSVAQEERVLESGKSSKKNKPVKTLPQIDLTELQKEPATSCFLYWAF